MREKEKMIAQINAGTVNLDTFKTDYIHRVGFEKLPPEAIPADDSTIEKAFAALKSTEKYKIRLVKKITRGEYLLIADSFIHNVVVTSISGTTEEQLIHDSYFFIFRKNSKINAYEVYSDLYETPQDKTIRTNFALMMIRAVREKSAAETAGIMA